MASKLTDYYKRMAEMIEQKGGCCVKCSSTGALEFDHIDPTTKLFTISVGWSRSREVVDIELVKCQLLCRPCHMEKCVADGSWLPFSEHGGSAMYTHHGCRCSVCVRANTERQRKYRQRKDGSPIQAHKPPAHGKASTYRNGCRCTPCREAHATKQRAYRGQRNGK